MVADNEIMGHFASLTVTTETSSLTDVQGFDVQGFDFKVSECDPNFAAPKFQTATRVDHEILDGSSNREINSCTLQAFNHF